MAKLKASRPVIICTEYRGVFFGYIADTNEAIFQRGTVDLTGARMAIYWGTTKGVNQLAATGPTPSSKISAVADMSLSKITSIFEVSEKAHAAWKGVE